MFVSLYNDIAMLVCKFSLTTGYKCDPTCQNQALFAKIGFLVIIIIIVIIIINIFIEGSLISA